MAALNIFKKPAATRPDVPTSDGKQVGPPKSNEAETPKTAAVSSGDSEIIRPHITEKATALASKNQYVFVVQPMATKKEVERSVEGAYGVQVVGVRMVTVHPKKMRLGRTKGVKKGYKKAVVKLQEGQSIEILPT